MELARIMAEFKLKILRIWRSQRFLKLRRHVCERRSLWIYDGNHLCTLEDYHQRWTKITKRNQRLQSTINNLYNLCGVDLMLERGAAYTDKIVASTSDWIVITVHLLQLSLPLPVLSTMSIGDYWSAPIYGNRNVTTILSLYHQGAEDPLPRGTLASPSTLLIHWNWHSVAKRNVVFYRAGWTNKWSGSAGAAEDDIPFRDTVPVPIDVEGGGAC